MSDRALDRRRYVLEQYRSQDNLAVRIRTHRLYSERAVDFGAWVLDHLPWRGGEWVLDAGCGTGGYVAAAHARHARYIGADLSWGMVRGLPAVARHRLNLDVQALPLCDATIDVVLANHMLYHVADHGGALREIRRVLRSGGALLAATNGQDNMRALYDLLGDVFARLSTPLVARRPRPSFTLENGAEILRAVFPEVTRHDLPGALRFPAPEPVIAYLTTMWDSLAARPRDDALYAEFVEVATARLAAHIARQGAFRVEKLAGLFVARAG